MIRRFDEWFLSVFEWVILGVIAVVVVILCVAAVTASNENKDDAPYGCTYIDLNSGKGADYRLACVEGYPK